MREKVAAHLFGISCGAGIFILGLLFIDRDEVNVVSERELADRAVGFRLFDFSDKIGVARVSFTKAINSDADVRWAYDLTSFCASAKSAKIGIAEDSGQNIRFNGQDLDLVLASGWSFEVDQGKSFGAISLPRSEDSVNIRVLCSPRSSKSDNDFLLTASRLTFDQLSRSGIRPEKIAIGTRTIILEENGSVMKVRPQPRPNSTN
jgi:hypothetical protein